MKNYHHNRMKGFVFIFVPVVLCFIVAGYSVIFQQKNAFVTKIELTESNINQMAEELFEAMLVTHLSDSVILSDIVTAGFADSQNYEKAYNNLSGIFSTFASNSRIYDHIRLIDKSGKEQIRVNWDITRGAEVAPDSSLQIKADRPYFKKGIVLDDTVYVSRFDLNIENNIIEQPFKPIIRITYPVKSHENKPDGLIVLNLLGSELIDLLSRIHVNSTAHLYLVNDKGDWLKGPSPDVEWQFMFEKGVKNSMSTAYPDEWQKMTDRQNGTFISDAGLFIFSTVNPESFFKKYGLCERRVSMEETWKMISFIDSKHLKPKWWNRALFLLFSGVLIIGFLIWYLTGVHLKRKQDEKKLRLYKEDLERLVKERTIMLEREIEEKEKIYQQSRKLSMAVEASPVSVVITDSEGNIEYVNPKFSELTQYEINELISNNPRILKSGKHNENFYKNMWRTIKSGREWYGEICNIKKDGSLFWEKASIGSIKNETGEITHFVGVKEDITSLKKMIKNLKKSRAEARRANRAKSLFLSSMSHELRTPLNSILGFAQLLMEDDRVLTAETKRMYAEKIVLSGRHLLRLINDILDLAKIESGKIDLSMEVIDACNVVEHALELLQPLADKNNIVLDIIAPQSPVHIKVDRTRYQQIILNLVSNAIKYNLPDGMVKISFSVQSGSASISVADTGPGIPDSRQGSLFRPFDRLGAENSNIEGTGIGLAITKLLVEKMDGQITFKSTAGKGSVFTVGFAHVEVEENGLPMISDTSSYEKNNEKRVPQGDHSLLYIEDNEFNRYLFEAVIAPYKNLKLDMAVNAGQGIEMARKLKPDLIFMDIGLPDMSGYKAFECLSQDPETLGIPVVALSANAMPMDIKKATKAGFKGYLTKPFSIGDLLSSIVNILETKS
ncbi:MAG: PAS domain S-box protein [Desulfamplus sp.]|nr:PAS domain S-box protein [Desulfamplus sp.]